MRVAHSRLPIFLLICGLSLCLATVSFSRPAFAEEEEKGTEAAPAEGDEAPVQAQAPPPEPVRIEGKLIKVDAEEKAITVMMSPDKGSAQRAFRKLKLTLDDNSLILIDQTPGNMSNLESGQLVQVGYFPKGKQMMVDTIVVVGKEQ